MKKSILIGVSIATVLAILLAAVALGFADSKTKFNAFADAKANEQVTDKTTQVATSTPTPVPAQEKTPEEAIAEAQTKVSFKILQPPYVPEGYTMNTEKTTGAKFRGVSLELEQASLFYTKGNEYLTLSEQLIIKDDTDVSTSKIPWKFVDINGVQGRFLEESDGVKSLGWKMGNLNFRISSYAYKENYSENESYFTGTSLSMEEMIKMARSIK